LRHITSPSTIESAGNKPKIIEEFIGRMNTETDAVSIAVMNSPSGWKEPAQRPDFVEYTIVLDGMLRVETEEMTVDVRSGEAIIVEAGEWVRYGSPEPGGARYVAVCLPAFSPDTVHREDA
jgi:mannose-6-phosphate isomerase-like protein (cupin superfamily)